MFQLIGNYSIAKIIGKDTFFLLVCKELFVETETTFWILPNGLAFLNEVLGIVIIICYPSRMKITHFPSIDNSY